MRAGRRIGSRSMPEPARKRRARIPDRERRRRLKRRHELAVMERLAREERQRARAGIEVPSLGQYGRKYGGHIRRL